MGAEKTKDESWIEFAEIRDGTKYSVLSTQCSVLSTQCSVLSTQCFPIITPNPELRDQNSVLRTRNSELGTRNFAFLFLALLAITGCSTTSLFSKFAPKDKFAKATPQNPAVRCLCLWEPSEGTGADNKPSRGVSGQIFFFTRGQASSVEVEGDVRVFLFDDFGVADAQAQPLHQFDFLAGSWQAHVTSTQFGPAYQLFVPYSRKGHHQAELAVRVRLTPPSGSPLFSEIAKVTLPGYERAKAKEDAGVYEPEATRSMTTNIDVARNERMTPDSIEGTLRQVMAERRSSAPVNGVHVTESPAASSSPRRTRRSVAPVSPDSDEEINVSEELHDNRDLRTSRPRRPAPEAINEADSNHEE